MPEPLWFGISTVMDLAQRKNLNCDTGLKTDLKNRLSFAEGTEKGMRSKWLANLPKANIEAKNCTPAYTRGFYRDQIAPTSPADSVPGHHLGADSS